MGRLTRRIDNGKVAYALLRSGQCVDPIDPLKVWGDRLAAYEETGLEPEEIERVLDAYGRGMTLREENCERLSIIRTIHTDRLKELVRAERDGRVVVRGQWNENGSGIIICSECEHGCSLIGRYTHYCPNCGAKMDLPKAAMNKREADNEAD